MKIGQEWTKDEVKMLRKLFGNRSNETVANMLNRSIKAVERKASRLGLRKTKKYMRSLGK